MSHTDVFEAALALPEKDRLDLVERLLDSLSAVADGVDNSAFAAEVRRRSDEIDQNKADLVPLSELKEEPS
jgi:putative addiction module component (TIGR02574 family)